MDTKYYSIPFAKNGNRKPVPEKMQGDGKMSYARGYTYDYERDLRYDPLALPVKREELNQVLFDITHNLQQWQEYGYYEYISDLAYNKGWRCVYHDTTPGGQFEAYVSLTDNNRNVPSKNGVIQPGWRLADILELDLSHLSLLGHKHDATDITSGILPIMRGGTNAGSYEPRRLLISGVNDAGNIRVLPSGANSQFLQSNGAGSDPSWVTTPQILKLYQKLGSASGTNNYTVNLNEQHTAFWLEPTGNVTIKINADSVKATRPANAWMTFEIAVYFPSKVYTINWNASMYWPADKPPEIKDPGIYFFAVRSLSGYDKWYGHLEGRWAG